jgi:hypothetical protein
MDEFNRLIKQSAEYKKIRDSDYRNESKSRLSKVLRKKVETTMIGALSSVEEHLGFLWSGNNSELTEQQKAMYDIYQKIRSDILDKGNAQARNIDAELNQYDVEWLRYSMEIPVAKPNQ